jgi:hypothetical protein
MSTLSQKNSKAKKRSKHVKRTTTAGPVTLRGTEAPRGEAARARATAEASGAAAPTKTEPEGCEPMPLWTDLSRRAMGFADEYPAEEGHLSGLALADLLLYGSASCMSDDPASDVMHGVADQIELLASYLRERTGEEWSQPAPCQALQTLARRARVAAALHVRASEALYRELCAVVAEPSGPPPKARVSE